MSDLRDAQSQEYLQMVPHYNSIFRTFEDPDLTPVLRRLIIESSLPLKVVEVDFAVDSSGFTTSRFIRWVDHKYGVVRQQHEWVKVYLMCGVKTKIVTAVEIREKDASDTKLLPDLVNATAAHFDMREVSADKGYSSVNNTNVIAEHGATPYIAFKSIHSGKAGGLWEKMFHYFAFNRQEFLGHYHKRSNVESTFSMINLPKSLHHSAMLLAKIIPETWLALEHIGFVWKAFQMRNGLMEFHSYDLLQAFFPKFLPFSNKPLGRNFDFCLPVGFGIANYTSRLLIRFYN
jgi:transposase